MSDEQRVELVDMTEERRLEELREHYKEEVWTTDEVRELFEVIGFMAPLVVVKSKATGKRGTLQFDHSPRVYFNFIED